MNGFVTANHALITIPFHVAIDRQLQIECVIDTGFIGYLTLPLSAVQAINLPFVRRMPANLADDSTIFVEVFEAIISWNGTLLCPTPFATPFPTSCPQV